MPDMTNEEVVHAYVAAITTNDSDAMGRLRHSDYVLEYPQSGERIRGHADERAIADHYPGGLPHIAETPRVVGSDDRWVITPSFTFERVAGSGEAWWLEARVTYPDGAKWQMVVMCRLQDGRIRHEVNYWAEPFDPPAWRAAWVQRIDPDRG
jgi:ketosteroid isomerase-like protein